MKQKMWNPNLFGSILFYTCANVFFFPLMTSSYLSDSEHPYIYIFFFPDTFNVSVFLNVKVTKVKYLRDINIRSIYVRKWALTTTLTELTQGSDDRGGSATPRCAGIILVQTRHGDTPSGVWSVFIPL